MIKLSNIFRNKNIGLLEKKIELLTLKVKNQEQDRLVENNSLQFLDNGNFNNKWEPREPETLASYRLQNGAKDKDYKKSIKLFNQHQDNLKNDWKGAVKVFIKNQWLNSPQSVNTGFGNSQESFFVFQNVNFYETSILGQDPLINKVLNILANTALAKGGVIKSKDLKEKEINKIEEAFNFYNLDNINRDCLKTSLRDGGCYLYIDFGLEDLINPLNLEEQDAKDFKGFKKIEAINIYPAEVNTGDPSKQDYMKPTTYTIVGLGLVHHTHLIKFANEEPADILKPLCLYLGTPLTLLIKEAVANTTLASQGLANLMNRFRYLFLKTNIEGLTANRSELQKRVSFWEKTKNNLGFSLIKQDEEVIQMQTNITGLSENVNLFYLIVSALTSIPFTELMGESANGMNATGEGNRISWHEKIANLQNLQLKSQIIKQLEIIGYILFNKILNFDYIFNPIHENTETERADIVNKNVDIAVKLQNLGIDDESIIEWLKSNETNRLDKVKLKPEADYEDLFDKTKVIEEEII